MWLGEYEDVPIEKIENKEVLKTAQITEESLLDLHKHTTLEEIEKLREDGIVKKQEEILRLKMSTSDQYILNRVDRMNAEARVKGYRNRFGRYKGVSLENLSNRAEERISNRLELLGRKALSKSQIGKRKKKMEDKHRIYHSLHSSDSDFREAGARALQEFMLKDYEKILKGENGASKVYLPEVQRENRYFKDLNHFAAWMAYEEKQDRRYRKPQDKELHKLLKYANVFEGRYEDEDPEKPVIHADRQKMLEIYEKQIMENTYLEDFDYYSKEDFVSKYEENYLKLKALMSADKLLQEMEAAGETYESPNHKEKAFRHKLKTLREIYEDYTTQRKIYGSDYYVLFAKKDLAGKSLKELEAYRDKMIQNQETDRELEKQEKQLEEKVYNRETDPDGKLYERYLEIIAQRKKLLTDQDMMQYMEGLISRKKSTGFKMGVSAKKIYEEMGKKELKEEYEETKREFTALLKGTGFKSAEKALKAEPADWVLAFRDYVFKDAQIDETKTFAAFSKMYPLIWTDQQAKKLDEDYGTLYQFWATREKLDKLAEMYRPENGSPYTKKEKEAYEQLKQRIVEAKDMMTRQFAEQELKYQNDTVTVRAIQRAQQKQQNEQSDQQ